MQFYRKYVILGMFYWRNRSRDDFQHFSKCIFSLSSCGWRKRNNISNLITVEITSQDMKTAVLALVGWCPNTRFELTHSYCQYGNSFCWWICDVAATRIVSWESTSTSCLFLLVCHSESNHLGLVWILAWNLSQTSLQMEPNIKSNPSRNCILPITSC